MNTCDFDFASTDSCSGISTESRMVTAFWLQSPEATTTGGHVALVEGQNAPVDGFMAAIVYARYISVPRVKRVTVRGGAAVTTYVEIIAGGLQ